MKIFVELLEYFDCHKQDIKGHKAKSTHEQNCAYSREDIKETQESCEEYEKPYKDRKEKER